MQNNFARSVYSANTQDIYNEANVFLRERQMKRGGKPRVLGKFDNLWMENPCPLKAEGIYIVIPIGADLSLWRCLGIISHASGLVKWCKSSSIEKPCLETKHWEGCQVRSLQFSPTPWQWDWSPFSLLCFYFFPSLLLIVYYEQF